jgi:hypothetical protein
VSAEAVAKISQQFDRTLKSDSVPLLRDFDTYKKSLPVRRYQDPVGVDEDGYRVYSKVAFE